MALTSPYTVFILFVQSILCVIIFWKSNVLESNESVAIVGANGAGKSTFIKLLCGLYQPTTGHVFINGVDACSLSFAEIHKVVSAVFQDFPQYQFSVRENIALGREGKIDNEEVLSAIQQFSLQDVCVNGIDQQLGRLNKDGINISAGQWQRIALARGCVAGTSFLVLDEPTASLDSIIEDRLYSELKSITHMIAYLYAKRYIYSVMKLPVSTQCDFSNLLIYSLLDKGYKKSSFLPNGI